MINSISIRTNFFDLDWNRHVTSRTYERFSQEGRYRILAENGYSIQKCMEESLVLFNCKHRSFIVQSRKNFLGS